MEYSAIMSAMEPVFLTARVSGVFPYNDQLKLSPFWSLLPPTLLCLVTVNGYFFYREVEGFSGFAGTMYVCLCWALTLSTDLLVVSSFLMGPLYTKLMASISDVENYLTQLGIQFSYRNSVILLDVLVRFLSLFSISILNFRAYSEDVLQLYLRAIGFYLNLWAISTVEMHIVALSIHLARLFKTAGESASPPKTDYILELASSLHEACSLTHDLLTKEALVTTAALFFCQTLDLYFIIIVVQDEALTPPIHVFTFARTLLRTYQLWRLVSSVGSLMDEAKKLDVKLYTMILEDQTNELAKKEKVFLYFAMKQKVIFSASGFFPIDFTLVHSIVAAATSYLVILVQIGGTSIDLATSTNNNTTLLPTQN